MKRSARWFTALALAACGLAAWWNSPPPEPLCEGVPLMEWIWKNTDADLPGDDRATRMIQRLRPVGLPAITRLAYLAEFGNMGDGPHGIFGQLLAKIHGRGNIPRVINQSGQFSVRYDERLEALHLLGAWGPDASPAIPALLRVLNSEDHDRVYAAAAALHTIGTASWPGVEDQLVHGSNLARCELLRTMGRRHEGGSGDNYAHVFNWLTQALRDPEPNIRRNAASSLAIALSWAAFEHVSGPFVDQAAAALWPWPDESNKEVREAKKAVQKYYQGTKTTAIPRLTALLADADETKRNLARSVLKELAEPILQR